MTGRLADTVVTVAEAAAFLATVDNRSGNAYRYYNPHNPDLPIRWDGRGWRFDNECADSPAVGFNILGAIACCRYLGGRLPTLRERLAACDDAGWPGGDTEEERIALHMGGISNRPRAIRSSRPVGGRYDLFGNVAEWCLPDDAPIDEFRLRTESFPVVGAGWNKDGSFLLRRYYQRWGRSGSVSVGFRPYVST